jgi:UDP-glucose 4-epimerase
MRALVTGGAGFIGSHLVRRLLARGDDVVVLDDLSSGRREHIAGLPVRAVWASIEDRAALRAAMDGCDAVFHLAAIVGVPVSMQRPATSLHTNVVGTAAVLEEATAAAVPTFVFASSASVYGDVGAALQHEDDAGQPHSPYGVSKHAGEQLCALFAESHPIRTVSLRYFNVYGPLQDEDGAQGCVVPTFVRAALADDVLTVRGDGRQTRDLIHVGDVVEATLLAATTSAMTGVYNVGTGVGVAIDDLASRIVRLAGRGRIRHGAPREGDSRHSRADIGRIAGFGFRARIGLDAGLDATIPAYSAPVSHPAVMRA